MWWEIPAYRVRAYLRNRTAREGRRRRESSAGPSFYRVQGELRLRGRRGETRGQAVSCRLILNDFGPESVRVFCSRQLPAGSRVELVIEQPRPFYVEAKVVSCDTYSASEAIISSAPHRHRVELSYVFFSDDERRAVLQFWRRLTSFFHRRVGSA